MIKFRKYLGGGAARGLLVAIAASAALSGCAEVRELFQPRIQILSQIEQDLYRAILASDKIEKVRVTHPNGVRAARATAPKEASQTAPAVQPVYLTTQEVQSVQMSFEGDANSFFERVADDIGYKIETSGQPRDINLSIKANGEPLFGVAVRAANYVQQDMKVRFDMEQKVIRLEYVGG